MRRSPHWPRFHRAETTSLPTVSVRVEPIDPKVIRDEGLTTSQALTACRFARRFALLDAKVALNALAEGAAADVEDRRQFIAAEGLLADLTGKIGGARLEARMLAFQCAAQEIQAMLDAGRPGTPEGKG